VCRRREGNGEDEGENGWAQVSHAPNSKWGHSWFASKKGRGSRQIRGYAEGSKRRASERSLRERASKKDMEDHVLFRRSLALGGAPELSALRSRGALKRASWIEPPLRICALIPSRRAAHDASVPRLFALSPSASSHEERRMGPSSSHSRGYAPHFFLSEVTEPASPLERGVSAHAMS
jgi:hypothetical protein